MNINMYSNMTKKVYFISASETTAILSKICNYAKPFATEAGINNWSLYCKYMPHLEI
jgi:hypothetical protein